MIRIVRAVEPIIGQVNDSFLSPEAWLSEARVMSKWITEVESDKKERICGANDRFIWRMTIKIVNTKSLATLGQQKNEGQFLY